MIDPQSQAPVPQEEVPRVISQPEKKISKPRLSLVERQSLVNGNRPTTDPSRKRRISSLHKPIDPQTLNISPDIFRFPSESPPKQPPPKPTQRASHIKPAVSYTEDKENTPVGVFGGRERRKTFNVTMEKLAQMTREEMQADKDWELNLANKRRRQSVAI